MKLFFLVSLLFANPAFANTNACASLNEKTLKIGCTFGCDWEKYRNAVIEAGAAFGVQVQIVQLTNSEDLSRVDGFYSPGGHDIDAIYYAENPRLPLKKREYLKELHRCYGNAETFEQGECFKNPTGCQCLGKEATPVQKSRDAFEISLFKEYSRNPKYRDLPALGVCYGWQAMAIASNIPLMPHLPAVDIVDTKSYFEFDENGKRPDKKVSILVKRDPQDDFDGYSQFVVNSNHHQGIMAKDMKYQDRNGSKFRALSTYGESKKVVYIAKRNSPPSLGIQFHSERSPDNIRLLPYKWLIEAACQKAAGLNR